MKILVVDDDRVLADVISYSLQRAGFQIIQAHDGMTALERWSEEKPDLIVMDVNLPRLDGFAVCQRIRTEAPTPIIFLTVRCEDADVVRGLELGADAYMTKPFSPRQLVARAQAILRRACPASGEAIPLYHDLQVSSSYREIYFEPGKSIRLTPLEGRLFHLLLSNPGQVQTFDEIMAYVWGARAGDRSMLRQLVHRLRNKIESDPAHPAYIRTVAGTGYFLVEKAIALE
jgi:DNA-binding response OmpR family regulator